MDIWKTYETKKRVYKNEAFLDGREGDEDCMIETVIVEARKGRPGETVEIAWDEERVPRKPGSRMQASASGGGSFLVTDAIPTTPPSHIPSLVARGEYVVRLPDDGDNQWVVPGSVFRYSYREVADQWVH